MHRVLAAAIVGTTALGLLMTVAVPLRPAFAQAAGADAADRERRARQYYEDGITQYNIKNFPKAIEEFKRAYELTRAPALLFNIAQAYRLAKDCENALSFYRTYVREAPGAANRGDAENFINEVEACAPQAGVITTPVPVQPDPVATVPEPTTPTTAVGETPALVPEQPDEGSGGSGKSLRLAGWITGGVGVAVFGVGVLYGLKAKGAESDIEGCTQASPCDGVDVERWNDDGARWEKLGIGGMAVGVALVGAGVTMVLLGGRSSSQESAVSAAVAPGGGSVVWQGRF